MILIDIGQQVDKRLVSCWIIEVALNVINAPFKPVPKIGVHLGGGEIADLVRDHLAKLFSVEFVAGESNQGKLL